MIELGGTLMKKRMSLIIMLVTMMLLVSCASTIKNANVNTGLSTESDKSEVASITVGLTLPFELQWGSSLEECASKFQNDWTLEENPDGVKSESTYILNQKQSLYGKEATVKLDFVKRPDTQSNSVPPNIFTLPEYFLLGVRIAFEDSAEEIKAELIKQYGEPISAYEEIGLVFTSFSLPEAQVKNITNENQKKAYHMYRYVVMQDYRELPECIQTPQETIQEQQNLYNTNPDELWNQIKNWNFDDDEHYLNSVVLTNSVDNPNGCEITYAIGDLLPLLNVE